MFVLVILLIVVNGDESSKRRANDFSSNATRDQSIVPCILAMMLRVIDNEASENDWDCRIALH